MQQDPVCKMQVDPQKSNTRSEYQGQTYYFCSNECKQKFDADPAEYTRDTVGQRSQSR